MNRRLSLFIAVSFSLVSSLSHSNELEKVWDSMLHAGGGATSYSTDSRNGATLGHFGVRVKTYNPNIVSVRAPYLQAGCSGIDFFGGSLSILKKEELVQMGRSLVAAAPMYAFQLAFDSLCPDCNAIMADLAKRMEKLNDLVKGDCKSIFKAFDGITNRSSTRERTQAQAWKDWADGAEASLFGNDVASSLVDQKKVDGEKDLQDKANVDLAYNSLYDTFYKTDLQSWSWYFSNDSQPHRVMAQLLMSLLGTTVHVIDDSLSSSLDEGGQGKTTPYGPVLTLQDFYSRSATETGDAGTSHEVFYCLESHASDSHCLQVGKKTVTVGDDLYVKPFAESVSELVCGLESDPSSIDASIRVRIPRKQPISASQRELIVQMGAPLRRILTEFSFSESQAAVNCATISRMIAVDMAIQWGREIVKVSDVLKLSQSAKDDKHADVMEAVSSIYRQLDELQYEAEDLRQKLQANAALENWLRRAKG